MKEPPIPQIHLTEEEWKARLTSEQYHVMREKGTERAFTGEYDNFEQPGIYECAACALPIFSSATKFHSGTGWPSFYAPIQPNSVLYREDNSLFTVRVEVLCAKCTSHLGHVFDDGPPPTGKRYCLNSVSLKFIPEDEIK